MKTIAISGKGGTGKTTLAALIIRLLNEKKLKPILAVDADPNVNLNELLGVKLKGTIGAIREEMKTLSNRIPGGMTKQQFLEYKIQSCLVENPGFDLVTMGRPEGPGCYCYANNLLRDILGKLNTQYQFIIIDNEAGMEHLSRRTTQAIDFLLIISDPTVRGIQTAGKISRLVKELNTNIRKKHLILNRVQGHIPQPVLSAIIKEKIEIFHIIPLDTSLEKWDQNGRPIYSIFSDSPSFQAADELLKKLLNI